jgi:hypothetical protein
LQALLCGDFSCFEKFLLTKTQWDFQSLLCKERKKFFTLKPLTDRIFAVALRRRQWGTGKNLSCSPLPSASLYGKNGYTTAAVSVDFVGLRTPRPRPLPKNRKLGIDI